MIEKLVSNLFISLNRVDFVRKWLFSLLQAQVYPLQFSFPCYEKIAGTSIYLDHFLSFKKKKKVEGLLVKVVFLETADGSSPRWVRVRGISAQYWIFDLNCLSKIKIRNIHNLWTLYIYTNLV